MDFIKPVSKDLLYMKVADSIHQYIQHNQLQPGDKIPSERDLAARLEISRASVREAIRLLEGEGILMVKVGSGTYVSVPAEDDSIYLRLFRGNYVELLEVKAVLERAVITDVIGKISKESLGVMEDMIRIMEAERKKGIYAGEEDRTFHQTLLKAGKNRSMSRMILGLIRLLDDYAQVSINVNKFFTDTVPCHRTLLEGLKAKDLSQAMEGYNGIIDIDRRVLRKAQPKD